MTAQQLLLPIALAGSGSFRTTKPSLHTITNAAVIPFKFSTTNSEGEQLITTGPLVDFYNRPHPYMNRFQYWELRVIWLMLRGECFRIPMFDGGVGTGRQSLKSVLILDPARFQHIVQDNRLIGWRYIDYSRNSPMSSQVFLPEEVWHERLPNPFDFWRGMPPLAVAATAAGTDYAASLFMKGIMENKGEHGTILRTSEQLDPEQREQILAALRERKRRAGTADRPVYDVMSGARLNFIENRVVPLCRRLESEDDVTVKAVDPKADGWFDPEDHPVLAAARRDRLAAARTGFDMGIPFNELNRAFDLGFKPLPWGDQGHIPSAMVPADGGMPPVAGSKLQGAGSEWRAGPDVFTRLAGAMGRSANRLPGPRGEVIKKTTESSEACAGVIGNRQAAFVVGRGGGSAGLEGDAPSAEKQPNQ